MASQETVLRSPLDKPLHQLTEEDISQLTREDCRRYLKAKGMRRPSWNKSQAIQQVISLKTLLESTPDSDAAGAARKKLHIAPRAASGNTPSSPSSAEETVPYRGKDSEKSDHIPDDVLTGHVATSDINVSTPPRTSDVPNVPAGQLTIFYCGKVNVYDDVPADKARLLMQLAASPPHLPFEGPFDGAATRQQALPGILQVSSVKSGVDAPVPTWISRAEGSASRKLSVQRYLEKRKDRFKSKRKIAPSSSGASMDVYLNHQTGYQSPSYHAIRSNTCSPTQIRSQDMPEFCENSAIKDPKFSPASNDKGTNSRMMRNNL
ncbi:protein TIFY 4B-like isoform X2 [Impatiens glandulifera]|uniref:protein TIFY 4B-like isoform X2 n=1 Tax=Impatiens glandulifera TaxID=253017 RepID=UPI001FB0ED49|nr:protein TIFY 4B-like isoform X2 [Impatiens glandulifera]